MELPPLDHPATIPAVLHAAAQRYGERDFVVMPDRRLTFAGAEATSRRVAKDLLTRGVGKGTKVAMLDTFSTEWVVCWLAVTRIGAVFVPLASTMKPPEARWTLRHADARLLVVPPTVLGTDMFEFTAAAVPGLADAGPGPLYLREMPYLREIAVTVPGGPVWATHLSCAITDPINDADLPLDGPVDDAFLAEVEAEVRPSDAMVIVHTSGSTADPKGVVHTHGGLVRHGANLLRHASPGPDPDERCFTGLPFFWVGGLSFGLLRAMHGGSAMLVMERFEPGGAIELLERERANRFVGWAPMHDAVKTHPSFAAHDLSLVRDFTGVYPPVGVPQHHNSLGMTETGGPHTTGPLDEVGRVLPEELRGSFGRPLPYVQHQVIDPETGAVLGDGEHGELCVRGYNLMAGIYKRERHEVFDDDGWYHTNDGGEFREGYFMFTGRLGEMIKTSGANVSPREVEVALEALPGVELAQVFGLPDEQRDEIVAAVLVPEPGAALDADAVVTALRERIATYKVPRRIAVVARADIPWLPTAKVDRRELARRLAAGELADR
jgi:acyl-CoA synthetase (AMP-forming)/AMP-acid ligase II